MVGLGGQAATAAHAHRPSPCPSRRRRSTREAEPPRPRRRPQVDALRISAEARAAEAQLELEAKREELHAVQRQVQHHERRATPAGTPSAEGRGLGSHRSRGGGLDDDDESLPSPVSIPSLPISPMVGRGAGEAGPRPFGPAAALEGENARLRGKVATLEEVAGKTKEVMAAMRAEVDRLRAGSHEVQMADDASSDEVRAVREEKGHLLAYTELLQARCDELARGGGPAATDANAAEVRMLRARVKSLDEASAHLRVQLRDAKRDAERAERIANVLRGELATARVAVREANAAAERQAAAAASGGEGGAETIAALQSRLTEVTSALAERTQECESLRRAHEGPAVGLVQQLQAKLATAETDLSRLVAEREKLMEISNMLRADLNRVLSERFVAPSGSAAERAEREVASRYETKLAEIESAMTELVGQNRALKHELHQWTAGTGAAASLGLAGGGGGASRGTSSLLRRATPETVGIGMAAPGGGASRAASASPPPQPMHAWLGDDGGGAGDTDGEAATDAESNDAALDGGGAEHSLEGVPSAERAWMRAAARRDSRPTAAAAGGMGGADPSSASSRDRARAKLHEARNALHLTGSAAPMQTAAPGLVQSDRAVPSQTKARLQDIQRKRAELIRKRQLVRNFNTLREDEAHPPG